MDFGKFFRGRKRESNKVGDTRPLEDESPPNVIPRIIIQLNDMLAPPIRVCYTGTEYWVGYNYPGYEWAIGMSRYAPDGKLIAHYFHEDDAKAYVNGIVFLENSLFAATDKGLMRFDFDHETWQSIHDSDGLIKTWNMTAIEVDYRGRVITGSQNGLAIIAGQHHSEVIALPFDTDHRLYEPVVDVFPTGHGRTWIIVDSENAPFLYLDDANMTYHTTSQGLGYYPQVIKRIADNLAVVGLSGEIRIVDTATGEKRDTILDTGFVMSLTLAQQEDFIWIIFANNRPAVTGVTDEIQKLGVLLYSLTAEKFIPVNPTAKPDEVANYFGADYRDYCLELATQSNAPVYAVELIDNDHLLVAQNDIYCIDISSLNASVTGRMT